MILSLGIICNSCIINIQEILSENILNDEKLLTFVLHKYLLLKLQKHRINGRINGQIWNWIKLWIDPNIKQSH